MKLPRGFTLIELLITVSIIGTLVVVMIPQLNSFYQRQTLQNTASEIQTVIRKIQNNATSGVNCDGWHNRSSSWMLVFTKGAGTYDSFAVCSDTTLSVTPAPTAHQLPAGAVVDKIILKGGCTDDIQSVFVFFTSISGKVTFISPGASVGCKNATGVQLDLKLNDQTQSIVIEQGGSVYQK